jgi:Flp pilus assembly protein TadG
MKKSSNRGQSLIEFALMLPLVMVLALGVIEASYALLDQHVVTKVTREGSNLISRDTTLEDAGNAMNTMSIRPLNFADGSKVIFSVIKRGATAGTPNFDKDILYQRHEFGALAGVASVLTTRGAGAFRGAPNYEAINSDTNTDLQITNIPASLVIARGGMVYVTEIYTRHDLLTPFHHFGVAMPDKLYSIAYF